MIEALIGLIMLVGLIYLGLEIANSFERIKKIAEDVEEIKKHLGIK